MTPGGNNLNRAMRLIRKQAVTYYKFAGRTSNDVGLDVASYEIPIKLYGSVQAVPQNYYASMGLDFQKNYVNFYCSKQLLDIQRDVAGDLFSFNGRMYQIESLTDWFGMDGWVSALAVLVDAEEPAQAEYLVTPDPSLYIITPDGLFITIPDPSFYVATPDGYGIITPDNFYILEPQ